MIAFSRTGKVFEDGSVAVKDLTMEVREGETLVLLGTSGCGKTTTLKMINRLIEPTSGDISVRGKSVFDWDPIDLRRSMGYVIQETALFPHMTISENIGLVPKLLKWSEERIADRVRELLELVGLKYDEFAERFPAELSGGQRQRVGVARALGANPDTVLMDEPFGALDPITREEIQGEFLRLEDIINKTIVFVTHDIFEAVRLADRIALMNEGELVRIDSPQEILENPGGEYAEKFFSRHRRQLVEELETWRKK